MSWALFAVIQLALTTVGITTVFLLRNRELTARLQAQEQVAGEATHLLEAASNRFQTMADEVLDNWLVERPMELNEDDPVQLVQKLVLQNEREPIPDFAEVMRRRIAAGSETESQNREAWLQMRMDLYDLASDLIARYPRSRPVVAQLYDSFAFRDAEFGVELPALPEPEIDPEGDSGESEQAEHLRAANELLMRQLEDAQKDVTSLRTTGKHQQQQEDDLKALLQQFTRDSRDMMACIQELEQENQRLRESLAASFPEDGAAEAGEAGTGGAQADDAA